MTNTIDWAQYFNEHSGQGYLSTADSAGKVNTAIYARPHIQQNGAFAFIMNEGRSSSNISQNPNALYVFNAGSNSGYRIYMERKEIFQKGPLYDLIISESRKPAYIQDSGKKKYVVLFEVKEVRPLVGG